MFSGIIERMATVADIREDGENKTFTMRSEIAEELRIDQSISHNGVCLTVESIANDTYTVTAIYETLIKSNLGLLRPGDRVNICLLYTSPSPRDCS